MNWIGVLLWLLPRRLRTQWGLLAITSFGILAAVTLMAIGPIYSRALAEGGLRHAIASIPPSALNSQVTVRNRPLGPQDYRRLQSTVEETAQARVGYMTRDTQRFAWSQAYPATGQPPDPGSVPSDAFQAQLFFLTEFEQHSRLDSGTWPQAEPVLSSGGVSLDIVVGRPLAREMGMRVGDMVYLVPFRTDSSELITLRVAGIAGPIDPQDEYWMGSAPSYYYVQHPGDNVVLPLYVSEKDFFGGLGARYPSLVADYGWYFFLDTDVVTGANVQPTRDALSGLKTDIGKRFPQSLVFSGLENTLANYQRDLTLAKAPLLLFLLLVLVVMLYFLALIMGLLTRTRADDASLLRSRGCSMPQMAGILALAEGTVVVLAVGIGPFLALAIVKYLLVDTINPAGGATALPVGLSADMFVMGAIGGILSLVVLVGSGLGLARMGMVESLRLRARPPAVPLLQRYYIDLAVLLAVGLVWWQISSREGFIENDLLGRSLNMDPSLLAGPVLALLALALLLFRALPWLMRLLAWFSGRLSSAWIAFGLVRAARDPLPHSSLAVILMMGTALGVFGAAFQPTLSRSEREQALFELGADVVIQGPRLSAEERATLARTDGVQAVGPVAQQPMSLVHRAPSNWGTLLAIDPESLSQTAWFRDDFSKKGISELVRPLRAPPGGVQRISLPAEAETLGVWVNTDGLPRGTYSQTLNLWFRVSDATGRYHNLLLGDLTAGEQGGVNPALKGWTFLEAPLQSESPVRTRPPFSLVSIFISRASFSSSLPPGRVEFDDVTVKGSFPQGDSILVESFDTLGTWKALPSGGTKPNQMELAVQASRTGTGAGLIFSWQEPSDQIPMGIFIPPGPFPLPAIGGPTFQKNEELLVRSGQQLVPILVSERTDLFPTVRPRLGPFLLVSIEGYKQYLERVEWGNFLEPDTHWVSLDDSADRQGTIEALRGQLPGYSFIRDSQAVGSLAQRDPLAGGGWNGLTIVSTVAITVAVVLALGTYAVFSVYAARVDLAVARSLGFSQTQFLLSTALEKTVVAVLGIAAGVIAGTWLARWVLGFLDVTETGEEVLPPMVVTSHHGLEALVVVVLVAAVGGAIFVSVLSARRLNGPDILRTGQ